MKMKVASYIADFLVKNGIQHIFTVTGGGAMHMNDSFGHDTRLKCVYNHHEQACAIGAEAYAKYSGKLPAVCVTSGPGGTNALTGVLCAWLDSIPMFVLSGQVKRETTIWCTDVPLRQLGDQEFNIVDSVKPMTKYAHMITDAVEIRYHLEKAIYLAQTGRGGPVWLDIPLDIQAAVVETEHLKGFDPNTLARPEKPVYDTRLTPKILEKIMAAKRPAILAGTGIRLGKAHEDFIKLADKLQIPVLTEWNGHDLLWDDHPCYCGRPGTIGTRGGNFIAQNCDLLLVLGSRLNIRMISYNYRDFAKDAYKIMVDIDEGELRKPTISIDLPVHADVKDCIADLLKGLYTYNVKQDTWKQWCREINGKYPATRPAYYKKDKPLNPYVFVTAFSKELTNDDLIITGNGSACVITFQAINVKKGQRIFTNSGCATMGYGFPAAIGASYIRRGERVICIDGDGSFQMNLQELETAVYNKRNIKLFYINNNGYHSVRQTQSNLFSHVLAGATPADGVGLPNAEKIAGAYGVPYLRIDAVSGIQEKLRQALNTNGLVFCEIVVDEAQYFEPKLSSRVLPDGKIISPPIDDMFPFLPKEEYEANKRMKEES